MDSKVVLKRSNVAGKKPETTDVDFGELAINTNDGRAYVKKDDGSGEVIVDIGSNTLVNLEDTEITEPVDGACIRYDLENSVWIDNDPMIIEVPEYTRDLLDFSSAGAAQDQVLIYIDGKWTPSDIVLADTLEGLTDTNVSGVNEGDILAYHGGLWVSSPPGSIDTSLFVKTDPTGIAGADKVRNMISLTQLEYDAIATKDPETLYLIKG